MSFLRIRINDILQYNVVYYNEDDYSDCDSLLNKAVEVPQSSLFEIIAQKIPQEKLLILKTASQGYGTQNGYMNATMLAGCLNTAKGKGWNGGLSAWVVC